jgi:hypothetical protein
MKVKGYMYPQMKKPVGRSDRKCGSLWPMAFVSVDHFFVILYITCQILFFIQNWMQDYLYIVMIILPHSPSIKDCLCLIKYVFRCLYIEDYNRFMFLTEIKNVGKRKLALMYNIRNVIGPLDTDGVWKSTYFCAQ